VLKSVGGAGIAGRLFLLTSAVDIFGAKAASFFLGPNFELSSILPDKSLLLHS